MNEMGSNTKMVATFNENQNLELVKNQGLQSYGYLSHLNGQIRDLK